MAEENKKEGKKTYTNQLIEKFENATGGTIGGLGVGSVVWTILGIYMLFVAMKAGEGFWAMLFAFCCPLCFLLFKRNNQEVRNNLFLWKVNNKNDPDA